jgi:hypothetical protein
LNKSLVNVPNQEDTPNPFTGQHFRLPQQPPFQWTTGTKTCGDEFSTGRKIGTAFLNPPFGLGYW